MDPQKFGDSYDFVKSVPRQLFLPRALPHLKRYPKQVVDSNKMLPESQIYVMNIERSNAGINKAEDSDAGLTSGRKQWRRPTGKNILERAVGNATTESRLPSAPHSQPRTAQTAVPQAPGQLANATYQIVIEGTSYRERLSPHRALLSNEGGD